MLGANSTQSRFLPPQGWFHTVQFGLLPSTSFLCLVDSKLKFKTPQLDPVELLLVDIERI